MEILKPMESKGIRIFEKRDNQRIKLSDILETFPAGKLLNWSILFLDGMPKREQGKFLMQYASSINKSENGLRIDWEELVLLSDKYFQMYETVIIGCADISLLHRYREETMMQSSCDTTIVLIDCAFWEVHSKNQDFVKSLQKSFSETKLLDE
jgi:hypothetical protein